MITKTPQKLSYFESLSCWMGTYIRCRWNIWIKFFLTWIYTVILYRDRPFNFKGVLYFPPSQIFFSHGTIENKNQIISVSDANKCYFVKYITTIARWKLQNHIFWGSWDIFRVNLVFFLLWNWQHDFFFRKNPIIPLKVKWLFPNHMFTTVWNYLLTCICVLLHLIDWLIDWSQISAIEDILRRER